MDPIVYEVLRVPPGDDQTPEFSITLIHPGKVGSECFFTRGHDHDPEKGETYFCISGSGGILVEQNRTVEWIEMSAGDVIQLRSGWAHRTVNTGAEPLVFSGHYVPPFQVDYGISELGFAARVFLADDSSTVVELTEPIGGK